MIDWWVISYFEIKKTCLCKSPLDELRLLACSKMTVSGVYRETNQCLKLVKASGPYNLRLVTISYNFDKIRYFKK